MINLTKEQIVETLDRLKDYSIFLYYSKETKESLKKIKYSHKEHSFTLDVLNDGLIEIRLENDVIGIFDFQVIRAPLLEGGQIENFCYQARILKIGNCEKEELIKYEDYFNEIKVFVLSFLQRELCLTFFARMEPESIDRIANSLVQCNK